VRAVIVVFAGLLAFVACTSDAPPSTTADPIASLRPLPAGMSGLPQPGSPSAVLEPRSQRGGFAPGVAHTFELGHCGLASPIDFDGSLWDPIAGDDGQGGPLTDDQRIELINGTPLTLVLLQPDVAQIRTPLGAVITLARHPGPRAYSLCD
jgi:hypothetical protein